MSNIMTYKGFTAKIEFSAEDNVFFGRLLNIDDVVTFEAETVEDIRRSLEEAVDFHIEVCEKTGKSAKKQYSGKILLRLPNALHERIAEAAASHGKSINEFSKEALEAAVNS